MYWIAWWITIKRIFWANQWGRFPILQGANYAKYFGGEDASSFGIWAAISMAVTDMDVISNGDIIMSYKSNIQ